ncbi:MAG: hypothetical protein PWQ60_1564 [Thermoanaerobacteraceae bacterium]|jgi:molybdenum cofactor synthesis domain-containing protein|nr:hypothetical protein [Thermoanaerobacteraceae bacterium]
MKQVPVEKAVGMILCQDITKIVPGEFKGRAFKKGHVIQKEDVDELLKLGKEHIYVWEPRAGEIHEDEAAVRLAGAMAGENVEYGEPKEGKSTLSSRIKGLYEVNSALLRKINSIDMVSVASLPGNFAVEKGRKLAGARVIPLVIEEEKIQKVENLCRDEGPAFKVIPYKKLKAAVITTGNEVFKGRIEDRFGPVILKKLEYFEADYMGQTLCPDDMKEIKRAILRAREKGADLIILTGGMSVDPDDLTPGAIKSTGARVVTYGAPVQPGNMFMMAYLESAAVLGVPGCAMYHSTTILDVVLPRIFAGRVMKKQDFIDMGEGSLCSSCESCRYPNCYFCR